MVKGPSGSSKRNRSSVASKRQHLSRVPAELRFYPMWIPAFSLWRRKLRNMLPDMIAMKSATLAAVAQEIDPATKPY